MCPLNSLNATEEKQKALTTKHYANKKWPQNHKHLHSTYFLIWHQFIRTIETYKNYLWHKEVSLKSNTDSYIAFVFFCNSSLFILSVCLVYNTYCSPYYVNTSSSNIWCIALMGNISRNILKWHTGSPRYVKKPLMATKLMQLINERPCKSAFNIKVKLLAT